MNEFQLSVICDIFLGVSQFLVLFFFFESTKIFYMIFSLHTYVIFSPLALLAWLYSNLVSIVNFNCNISNLKNNEFNLSSLTNSFKILLGLITIVTPVLLLMASGCLFITLRHLFDFKVVVNDVYIISYIPAFITACPFLKLNVFEKCISNDAKYFIYDSYNFPGIIFITLILLLGSMITNNILFTD
jgi:hypothetical protein